MARYRSTASPDRTRARRLLIVVGGVAVALLLSACASDSLANQYRAGSGKNFIAGDGSITEITAAKRLAPVEFSGALASGSTTTSADYQGPAGTSFWVDVPGQVGDSTAHYLGFLFEEPDAFLRIPQLG